MTDSGETTTMPTTVLVISDLHLGDGNGAWELWRDPQQASFASLLAATQPGGALADEQVELVINGDCFDFLLARPELGARLTTDVLVAHAKWAGIAAAHDAWFAQLQAFTQTPGHRVTFIIGNHDLELYYPSIRARVRRAIDGPPGTVRFCLTRAYQPLPDVIIEHGCQSDPWNAIPAIWDGKAPLSTPGQLETGDLFSAPVGPLALPWGARYFYRVLLPVKQHFAYFDMMYPDIGLPRQGAVLALLAPDLMRDVIERTAALLSDGESPSVPSVDASPQELFTASVATMQRAAADVYRGDPAPAPDILLATIQSIYEALGRDPETALREIFTSWESTFVPPSPVDPIPEVPAKLVVIGHTHAEGRWKLAPDRTLLNTGTWARRYALPTSSDWSPELRRWLADPLTGTYPGRDGTRLTVAWLRAEPDAALVGELIAWQPDGFVPAPDDGHLA
jgi:UDP-2,3-diacylglucosamine pyrophosphatase LpxH